MDNGTDRGDAGDAFKQDNDIGHGREAAGGPGASDMAAPGGSSGGGGYGADQNAANQGLDPGATPADPHQSRGERHDELSGGGRGAGSVSFDQVRDGDDARGEPSGDDPV